MRLSGVLQGPCGTGLQVLRLALSSLGWGGTHRIVLRASFFLPARKRTPETPDAASFFSLQRCYCGSGRRQRLLKWLEANPGICGITNPGCNCIHKENIFTYNSLTRSINIAAAPPSPSFGFPFVFCFVLFSTNLWTPLPKEQEACKRHGSTRGKMHFWQSTGWFQQILPPSHNNREK